MSGARVCMSNREWRYVTLSRSEPSREVQTMVQVEPESWGGFIEARVSLALCEIFQN